MNIVFVYFIYVFAWVLLVGGTVWLTLKFSKSKLLASFFGVIVFFAMYWPAFGDLIPTLGLHKQLCEDEAGFKVYVTPEKWVEENPGTLETLVPYNNKKYKSDLLNERFSLSLGIDAASSRYPVKRSVSRLVDMKTKKTIYEYVDFKRGYGTFGRVKDNRSLKIWLEKRSCVERGKILESVNVRKNILKKLNAIEE